MVKSLVDYMETCVNKTQVDSENPMLKCVLGKSEICDESINRVGVLLDGGASHNVFLSPKIPTGAVCKDVELAHGTIKGMKTETLPCGRVDSR